MTATVTKPQMAQETGKPTTQVTRVVNPLPKVLEMGMRFQDPGKKASIWEYRGDAVDQGKVRICRPDGTDAKEVTQKELGVLSYIPGTSRTDYLNSLLADAQAHEKAAWAMADKLQELQRFGLSVEQVADFLHMEKSTLRNYASVGKAFPKDKRVDGLSLSHHAAVLGRLGTEEKPGDGMHLLKVAAQDKMTVSRLRLTVNEKSAAELIAAKKAGLPDPTANKRGPKPKEKALTPGPRTPNPADTPASAQNASPAPTGTTGTIPGDGTGLVSPAIPTSVGGWSKGQNIVLANDLSEQLKPFTDGTVSGATKKLREIVEHWLLAQSKTPMQRKAEAEAKQREAEKAAKAEKAARAAEAKAKRLAEQKADEQTNAEAPTDPPTDTASDASGRIAGLEV